MNPELAMEDNHVTAAQATAIGDVPGVRWGDIDAEEFREGLEAEMEEAQRNGLTSIANSDWLRMAQLVLAHLRRQPDYYSSLVRIDTEEKDEPGG